MSSQPTMFPVDLGLLDTGGGGDNTPLVMLHGWTGSKEDFSAVVGPLSEDRRVIIPDLPGHGDTPSVGRPEAYALGHLATWVLNVLDDLGVGDVHLLGHSMGGLLAQRVAYLAAHRLESLTLVGTGLGAVNEETAARIVRIALAGRDHGLGAAWDVVLDDAGPAGADPVDAAAAADPRADFVRDRFMAMSVDALVGGARTLVNAAPLGAFLRGMDFPVLVCHGEGDESWLPHEQRLLARTITGSTYRVIADALHSPAVENPDGFLDIVRPFLRSADPGPG